MAEKRMAKERGARLHPMSGAGRIKDDASTDESLYEFKNAARSHTLKGKDLLALFKRGVQQDKEPLYVVYFEDVGIVAEIHLSRGWKQ